MLITLGGHRSEMLPSLEEIYKNIHEFSLPVLMHLSPVETH